MSKSGIGLAIIKKHMQLNLTIGEVQDYEKDFIFGCRVSSEHFAVHCAGRVALAIRWAHEVYGPGR